MKFTFGIKIILPGQAKKPSKAAAKNTADADEDSIHLAEIVKLPHPAPKANGGNDAPSGNLSTRDEQKICFF